MRCQHLSLGTRDYGPRREESAWGSELWLRLGTIVIVMHSETDLLGLVRRQGEWVAWTCHEGRQGQVATG